MPAKKKAASSGRSGSSTQRSLNEVLRAEDYVIERLTRVEERQVAHVEVTRANFEELRKMTEGQEKSIKELTAGLNRYKGFWGGAVLLASGIAAALTLFKEWLFAKIGVH